MKTLKLCCLLLGTTMIVAACGSNKTTSATSESSEASEQVEEVKNEKKWETSEKKDEMTDKVTKTQELKSDEPQVNDINSSIIIDDGKNVLIRFDKSLVLSINAFSITKIPDDALRTIIKVRFDDGNPETFKLDCRDNEDSKKYKMANPKKFIDACKTAKEIKIQFSTSSYGDAVYKYTTAEPLPQE